MKKLSAVLLLFSLLCLSLLACAPQTSGGAEKFDFVSPATDAENFVYTPGATITALTEAGKAQETLLVPADAAGIAADVLKTSSALKHFVLGERERPFNFANGCFDGTKNLNVYIGCSVDKATCGGAALLTGATGITFYIVAAQHATFKEDYTWGAVSDQIKKYESAEK